MTAISISLSVSANLQNVENGALHMIDVGDFGAKGDGVSNDTTAFQMAIDACKGENTVVKVGKGRYIIGTITLKSRIELYVEEGAEILGSTSLSDYATDNLGAIEAPAFDKCLIYAEHAKNIRITGRGIINGRGFKGNFPIKINGMLADRPMLIRFVDCSNIVFKDITLKNSASWCTHLVSCRDIDIANVTVDSRVNANNDGFDLDGCRNVSIHDCHLKTGDDSICPKSTSSQLCENIVVRNCKISSHTAAIKCGTSSKGGFKNITVSNCEFYDCRMGAIKLLLVDGGVLEDITISDIIMNNVEGPLFIRLGDRGRIYDKPTEQIYEKNASNEGAEPGQLRNVHIRNICATVTGNDKARQGIMITGIPGHCVENVILENLDIVFTGNGSKADASRVVPEDSARYPEQFFFGVLPSYGLYLRHVKGITLKNVNLSLKNPDMRPKIVCEEVSGFRLY